MNLDVLNLLSQYLSDRRFRVTRHEPSDVRDYPWLVVKKEDRKGWVKISDRPWRNFIEVTYYKNGHDRGSIDIDINDPESIPRMMRFIRDKFRRLG